MRDSPVRAYLSTSAADTVSVKTQMSARAGAEDAYILTRTVGGAVTATTTFTSVIRAVLRGHACDEHRCGNIDAAFREFAQGEGACGS